MRALLRLLIALIVVTAATGCGTGFVNGWREEKEPEGTPAERCERREGYSWLGDECQKDSGLDLGDVSGEEQCKQIENAGWFENACIAYKDLNAEQCATIATWGWLDGKCRTQAEIACLALPGKTYVNDRCLDRPTITLDGDLEQTIVAGFAITPITVAPAEGSTAAISSQTCPGFFKLAAGKLESTNATELDAEIKKCAVTLVANTQAVTSEPVTVAVNIAEGFLRICESDAQNNTVRLLIGYMTEATDCVEGANALVKWETTPSLDHALIDDLRPFAGLRLLKKLIIPSNRIVDLSPLSGLTALKTLDIAKNQVTDLRPIAGLTKLETLFVADNLIAPAKCPVDAKSPAVAAFCKDLHDQ